MRKRAASAAETRRRLIEATVALHGERGVLATRPADIAARADVALTTYYKHFPSLDDLVRACGGRLCERLPPPDPAGLAGVRRPERIAAMVRTLFDDYELRERWLHVARAEERAVPALQHSMSAQRATRDAFVQAALGESGDQRETAGVVAALVDFWAWRTLRREVGLSQAEAIRAVTVAVQRLVTAAPATDRKE